MPPKVPHKPRHMQQQNGHQGQHQQNGHQGQQQHNQKYRQLTQEQADHFVQHGWLKLDQCFTPEQAAEKTKDMWTRLQQDPNDRSTWIEDNHMPTIKRFPIKVFAPKAWDALCDLVGDTKLIQNKNWNDGFIVNLGSPEGEGKDIPPERWHVDGQAWINYLDSPEQGLLLMPLFSDIRPGGGGTMICPAALPTLAKHLHDHPEGLMPGYRPVGEGPNGPNKQFQRKLGLSMPKDTWVEVTGKAGDVYVLHPFMLHSRVNNKNRDVRIVTNNRFPLLEPFKLYREDPSQYSLIERSTLHMLGKDEGLKDWHITGKREWLARNPNKRGTQEEEVLAEKARVKAAGHGYIYDQ